MTSLRTHAFIGLAAFAVGVAVALASRRAPMRGWLAVALVLVPGLLWALMIDTRENAPVPPVALQLGFLITAPLAFAYSYFARRHAPDRILARVAFFGSVVVAVLSVLFLCGLVSALI